MNNIQSSEIITVCTIKLVLRVYTLQYSRRYFLSSLFCVPLVVFANLNSFLFE